jgi:uncharacterized protein YaiL (DUF2058 family)
MSNSLRDQLLGLGFKKLPKPETKPERKADTHSERKAENRSDRKPQVNNTAAKPSQAHKHSPRTASSQTNTRPQTPKSQAEIDLAKAYAMRSETEKQERIEAERLKQEEAKRKRELKAKVQELLKDKAQNSDAAEQVRHFEYNGKIRRIYVTPDQLKAINAGDLGLVQLDGRYLIVTAELVNEVKGLLPSIVALLVDPNAPAGDDPYSDPQYVVPDDLMW